MTKYKDITGEKFGRLTAIQMVGIKKYGESSKALWKCLCECGNETFVTQNSLQRGNAKSCGCLKIETSKKIGRANKKHGMIYTRLYSIWHGIKSRCYSPKMQDYQNYGGRGITVCDEWRNNFEPFRDWAMENGYTDELTIDRIDVNGNYSPENCRWITARDQARNKTDSRYVTVNGVTKILEDWAAESGIIAETIAWRLDHGYSPEDAVSIIPQNCKLYTYNNETLNLSQWAKKMNMKRRTLSARINMLGWDFEKAITTPVRQNGSRSITKTGRPCKACI